jgi:hypothetical protein
VSWLSERIKQRSAVIEEIRRMLDDLEENGRYADIAIEIKAFPRGSFNNLYPVMGQPVDQSHRMTLVEVPPKDEAHGD